MRLERRLEASAEAFLRAVDPTLALAEIRGRDEDGPVTEADAPPTARIIIVADDQGRIGLTPIRRLSLRITARANAKTAAGAADAFDDLCGRIEAALDLHNLQAGLSSPTLRVLLAVRRDGLRAMLGPGGGWLREETFPLEIKAVGAEHVGEEVAPGNGTPGGTGNATVPSDAPIQPPQAFVDAAIRRAANGLNAFGGLANLGATSVITWLTQFYSNFEAVINFDASGNDIAQPEINDLLSFYVMHSEEVFNVKEIDLSGGTNAAPSGQGLVDLQTLRDAGWTVTVNP